MMTYRERIRFLRQKYNLSQDALARNVIGENGKAVTRNYINMIENINNGQSQSIIILRFHNISIIICL